jgi:VWFA-related protein
VRWPAGAQQPTFRAGARAIEVDAFVTDRDGRFVRGLTRDDFEVLEDGQPQAISAFTMVSVPVETAARARDRRPTTVDSDVVTNSIEGRVYVMLLDTPGLRIPDVAHVTRDQMFRLSINVARRFVNEALGPDDRMAVILVQENRSDAQSFTSNKALLRAAIDRLRPDQQPAEAFGAAGPYCDLGRLRNTYEVLQTVAERLGATTGRRKTILWVNGRVPLDASTECVLPDGRIDAQASMLSFMHRDALSIATRNNVVIYPIDPVGLNADPTVGNLRGVAEAPHLRIARVAALRGIAEDTGGEAIINTNNFSGNFERLVQANSTYYLLGYQPPRDHRDGQFHTITVRVRRPGLSVRARKGYLAPEPGPSLEQRLLPTVSEAGGAALVNPFPSNGLGLQLQLAPFRGQGRTGSVVLAADVHGLRAGAAPDNQVELSFLAIDAQGATRTAAPKRLPLDLSGDPAQPSAGVAVRYVDRLALPPGRHEVRMAVHQPGGATGSVVGHVEVPDYSRLPLSMSGVVLAAASARTQPTLQRDLELRLALLTDPTTRRRFARADMLQAYVEVYVEERTTPADIQVAAMLTGADGKRGVALTPERVAAKSGQTAYVVPVAFADVAPGEYLLTLEARAGRRSVSRSVPFTIVSE